MDIKFVTVSIQLGKQKPLYIFNAEIDLMLIICYEVTKSAKKEEKY